jgi:hypothetical protein
MLPIIHLVNRRLVLLVLRVLVAGVGAALVLLPPEVGTHVPTMVWRNDRAASLRKALASKVRSARSNTREAEEGGEEEVPMALLIMLGSVLVLVVHLLGLKKGRVLLLLRLGLVLVLVVSGQVMVGQQHSPVLRPRL